MLSRFRSSTFSHVLSFFSKPHFSPQCNGIVHTVSFLLTAVVTCRFRKLATVSPQVRLDTEAIMEHGCKLKETTGAQAELGMVVRKGKRTGPQKTNSVFIRSLWWAKRCVGSLYRWKWTTR